MYSLISHFAFKEAFSGDMNMDPIVMLNTCLCFTFLILRLYIIFIILCQYPCIYALGI